MELTLQSIDDLAFLRALNISGILPGDDDDDLDDDDMDDDDLDDIEVDVDDEDALFPATDDEEIIEDEDFDDDDDDDPLGELRGSELY